MTIHSAFALPVMEFSGEIPNLSSDMLNTLRSKLLCLKLIITQGYNEIIIFYTEIVNTYLLYILVC